MTGLTGAISNAVTSPSTTAAYPSNSTSSSSASSGSGGIASLTKANNFLPLLVAQMQNQSPTSPADPSQMTQEVSGLAEVSGITQLNTELSTLASQNASTRLSQAADLVGKQVAVPGNSLIPDNSGAATGAFSLANTATSAKISITDASNAVVGTVNLTNLSAGTQSFSWSGGKAGEVYHYSIAAQNAAGQAVSVTPYAVQTVAAVNLSGTTPSVNLQGSTTPVPASSVAMVL